MSLIITYMYLQSNDNEATMRKPIMHMYLYFSIAPKCFQYTGFPVCLNENTYLWYVPALIHLCSIRY